MRPGVASPFFDVNDDSGRVTAALCKSMARGGTRENLVQCAGLAG